jgi:hypothetical protein
VAWSLGANLVAYGLMAARKVKAPPLPVLVRWQSQVSDMGQLKDLVASFIGQEKALREFPEARRGAPSTGARPSGRGR